MTQQQITRNESTNTATKITAIRTTVNPIISPFFQWVGGKRKFIDKLLKRIPLDLNNYYEPFLGGVALFFQVKDNFNKCFYLTLILNLQQATMLSKRIQQKLLHYMNYIN